SARWIRRCGCGDSCPGGFACLCVRLQIDVDGIRSDCCRHLSRGCACLTPRRCTAHDRVVYSQRSRFNIAALRIGADSRLSFRTRRL
ncbi:uncharacterized protein METZ01_LOCUS261393, partial [marine metagenome]